MRNLLTVIMTFWGGAALADPGHMGTLAGHDHWVAGAAIGLAILIGLAGALKGRKDSEPEESSNDEEEVPA
jgi:hypothetical protein